MKDRINRGILVKGPLCPMKKCPFCSASGEAKSEKTTSGKRMYFVECVQCHARTALHRLLADAIKQWDNQRYDKRELRGKWLRKKDEEGCYIKCSVCGLEYGYVEGEAPPYSKYCPECGARLVQTEQTIERKIPFFDQIEAAERIKTEKNKKDRMEKIETYRRQEMAEDFLRKMIGVEEDDENEETNENEQLVY